jgi:hypothetical protein
MADARCALRASQMGNANSADNAGIAGSGHKIAPWLAEAL